MQTRCSKKGCKKHEKYSKMEATWEPKSRNSRLKTRSENWCEKRVACPDLPGGSAVCGWHPLKTNHLFSSRLSSRVSSRLGIFSRLRTSCHVSRSRLSCHALTFVPFCVFRRVLSSCWRLASRYLSRQGIVRNVERRSAGSWTLDR